MGSSSLHEERERERCRNACHVCKVSLTFTVFIHGFRKTIQSYLKICVVSTTGACLIPSPPKKKQKEKKTTTPPGHFFQAKIVIPSFLFD